MARFVAHGFGVVVAMNLPVALGAVILEPQSRASTATKKTICQNIEPGNESRSCSLFVTANNFISVVRSQTLHLHDNCRKKADFMAKRKIAGDEFRVCFQAYRCEKR